MCSIRTSERIVIIHQENYVAHLLWVVTSSRFLVLCIRLGVVNHRWVGRSGVLLSISIDQEDVLWMVLLIEDQEGVYVM